MTTPSASAKAQGVGAEFVRQTKWLPAYDSLPQGGIGSMRIRFVLVGPKGAIQWMIGTEWFTASARDHLAKFPTSRFDFKRRPEGWDLGYHAYEPQYEGQTDQGECDVLHGAKCFYDGSGLQAELLIEGFLAGGEDYLWPTLEAVYRHRFEDAAWPFEDVSQ